MNFPSLIVKARGRDEAVKYPLDESHSTIPRWEDFTLILRHDLGIHFLRHALLSLGRYDIEPPAAGDLNIVNAKHPKFCFHSGCTYWNDLEAVS